MKIRSRWSLVCVLGVVLCSLGCATARPRPPEAARPLIKQVEQGQSQMNAVEGRYRAMSVAELARQLEADSLKDVEPYNSLAYREAISRGSRVGPELAALVKTTNRASLFALLAVRKNDAGAFGTIAATLKTPVFIEALQTSKFFNCWGLPHLYWEDAAKAIIELRRDAVEPLKSLLKDRRPAPVWGSEEVLEYSRYKYRVCDYAWALLMEIQGMKETIPVEPTARDALIARSSN